VLFPFPNRIRDGRFTWDGREYRLPPNDPAMKNAIHGFACRRPWRVVDQGADAEVQLLHPGVRSRTTQPEGRGVSGRQAP
jgi:aldose 1-epimerase